MAFTTAVALELARDRIRVNSVCPGFIDTPFNNPAITFMGGREEQARIVERMERAYDDWKAGRWSAEAMLRAAS
jgi:NAD(P)-dependent dehydrogenase (short-subunit alcohol dehydrogenase family)